MTRSELIGTAITGIFSFLGGFLTFRLSSRKVRKDEFELLIETYRADIAGMKEDMEEMRAQHKAEIASLQKSLEEIKEELKKERARSEELENKLIALTNDRK